MSPEALWLILPGLLLIAYLSSQSDRQRIRQYVESGGGKMLKLASSGARRQRQYEVTFRRPSGAVVHGVCRVGLIAGLAWLKQEEEAELLGGPSRSDRVTDVEALEEAALCLACGAEIPPRRARCPYCGWSYKEG